MECNQLHYLKSYRKRAGISLKDMAQLLGLDAGNLSRMEAGKTEVKISIAIAYFLVLNIPLSSMFKHHYAEINADILERAHILKEGILEDEGNHSDSPHYQLRTRITEAIIDRLVNQRAKYEGA